MLASSDTAIASASSANASGWPWKFPAETSMPSSTSTSGLSVAAFSSVVDRVLDVVEQVARRAVHLRRATKRVRVLHLVAPAVRLDDRRALEQAQHVARRRALTAQRSQRVHLRDERVARALQRLERERARAVGGLREPPRAHERERALRGHELRAVDQRQPFLRDQPHRLEPGALERVGAVEQLAVEPCPSLADERQREVRERREVAATRRPSRARARTGRTPRFRHSSSSSTVSTRAPELPFASAFARSSIAARTTASGYGSPTPHACDAEQAQLQLLGQLLRDRAARRTGRSRY